MPKKSAKPVVKAKVARACSSPAKDYFTPNLFKIAVELIPDEPEFTPVYVSPESANVCALVPTLNHQGRQIIRLNHRCTELIDCGISLVLPAGYQISAKTSRSYACRGLLVSGCFLEDKRLKIAVTNVGTETPLLIGHREVFAQIYLQPTYYLEWNK